MPWRSIGLGAGAAGVPVATGWQHPLLGQAVTAVEAMVIIVVLTAALFGSLTISERAFRLLRWIADRPEPPTGSTAGDTKS